jgi:hypothetical protein
MIIQGITLTNTSVYDSSFNSKGALLYLDAGQAASYSGSGTTWTDLSTNTNNGTITGSPTYSTAWNGNFAFNGTVSQFVSTVAAKYNSTYTGKTVFVVARLQAITTGTYRCMFGCATGNRNFNTYIYSPSSGVYQIHYSTVGGGGVSNNLPLTLGQWFVLAVTQDATGLITYYFNGQPVGTNTGQTLSQWSSNTGENISLGDNYWNGDIPVCAVYGRALNPSEIKQNYNSLAPRYGLGIVTTGLVANYDTAGYASGSTVADTSGNGRSLTLYNTPSSTTANRSPVITYNGSTQYAQDNTGYGTTLNAGTGYTYDLWVNPTSITNGTLLAEWGNNTFNSGWRDAQMGFLNNIVAGYFSGASTAYTPVSAGTWYNIIFTYNGTNQGTLYVNGTARGTTGTVVKSNSSTGTFISLARPDASGAYLGGLNGYYSGQVGAFKLYSKALSSTEVTTNFQALRNRYGI